ncbi:MAG TPA: hypothetical protein VFL83_23360 [Anaeromyxobacter sp.]|nr:hypothetical protein [Anaeromyxobacter sp.]
MRGEALAAWLRGGALPAARARIARAIRAARRHPEAVLAATLVVGVVVMILHWS